jgi:hypothetical protein
MTTTPPPEPSDQPSEPDRPASLAEQAAAALDVSADVLTVLEEVVRRVEVLEHAHQSGVGTENRADFRFEHYPLADTDDDQLAQVKRALAAWQRLDAWVEWLVAAYKLTAIIPPCWPQHPTIREELIGLRVAWTGAWSNRGSHEAIVIFHEKLTNARIRLLDSNWGHPRCPGQHDDSGLDLAEQYRAWAATEGRNHAVIVARDHALALVRAGWSRANPGGEQ